MSTPTPSQSSADTTSVNVPFASVVKQPKNKLTYISQITVIYTIIAAAIIYLSLQAPDKELWLVLLSSTLGYILPSPNLKFVKTSPSSTTTQP